ncbi:MAG: GEVED domain-containing protein, partial [Chthoniobacteraceae bacterium]
LAPHDLTGNLNVDIGKADIVVASTATMGGSGTFRTTMIVGGRVVAGRSPGTLTIDGDPIFLPTAEFVFEAAGTAAGQSDLIQITGDAVLAGKVQYAFIDGYAPLTGDNFSFMTIGGNREGAFSDSRIVGLAAGFEFDSAFDDQGALVLTALNDGVALPAELRGVVFDDANTNGVRDSGEGGRAGVTVQLHMAGSLEPADATETVTDANGGYVFADLVPGNYQLTFVPPAGTNVLVAPSRGIELQGGVVVVAFPGQAGLNPTDDFIEEVVADAGLALVTLDFGDAPVTYPTLSDDDGARHLLITGFHLGAGATADTDGQPGDLANADANDDGVTFSALTPDQFAQMTISVALPDGRETAHVDAWIDWNANGNWDEAGEHVLITRAVGAGNQTFRILVPADAVVGSTFARIRLSNENDLAPTGQVVGGEVEDYQVQVNPAVAGPAPDVTATWLGAPPDMVFPKQKVKLKLQLDNQGDADFAGSVPVEVFFIPSGAELDDALPALTINKKLNLKTGASTTLSLSVRTPTDLPAGAYQIVALVNGESGVGESHFANNAAATEAVDLSLALGLGGAKKLTFRGVSYSLNGNATGLVIAGGPGAPDSVEISVGDPKASLALKAGKGVMPEIGAISVAGSLAKISASKFHVQGDVSVTGLLKSLKSGDITDAVITVQGVDPAAQLKFFAGQLTNVAITSAVPIKSLKIDGWADTDATTDRLEAPFVGRATVTSDLSSDWRLTDALAAVSLKSLTVKGVLGDSVIRAASSIAKVTVGRVVNSSLFAGVMETVTGLPDDAADFANAIATISKLTVKGIGSIPEPSFMNSQVAAPMLGAIALKGVQTANDGVPFGFAADISLKGLKRTGAIGLASITTVGLAVEDGDFAVLIV